MTAPGDASRNVQEDLRAIIEARITAHPRSQQTVIGASEIGTACTRKLAHKINGTPRVRPEVPAWRPTVGTAVHSWLEGALMRENARLGWDRWSLEERVLIGTVGGVEIYGHCDVFDKLTGTVIDWKVPGITTIKNARKARHPGNQYRVQAHCYGLGYSRRGLAVKHVAVYFLPAAGELGDAYYWSEPFDPAVAAEGLKRADALAAGLRVLGADMIPQLPIEADYCTHCPWWSPGATDLRVACPGHADAIRSTDTDGPAFGRVRTHTPKGSTA